ncbi:putative helicase [Caerostris extrusa]|uniref:Helicase n=1 Tax=Caerostris extrusa TaxID=172846 RepID=A0AAV4U8N0_CAEEX|nr:putative helicase [Caerostris extrusa]
MLRRDSAKSEDDDILSHKQLIKALFETLPHLKQVFRYVDGVGTFMCDETTHVWNKISSAKLEYTLSNLVQSNVSNLSPRETKFVGQFNYLTYLRKCFQSFIEDPEFIKKLDNNTHLFALQNRVLDSLTKEFRPLCWDDYVSKTCDWAYSSDESRLYMPEVKRFFETVFPIQEERDYVLHFLGSLLDEHRDEKQFLILTDKRSGSNGKTTFVHLMKRVFTSYAMCKSSKVLCKKARLKGVRLLIVDEFNKRQKLNCGFLKAVTEGDYCVDGRSMYSTKTGEFMWQAGIVLVMNENDFPKFDFSDKGFMKKNGPVPFRSKFVEGFDTTQEPHTFCPRFGNFKKWMAGVRVCWTSCGNINTKTLRYPAGSMTLLIEMKNCKYTYQKIEMFLFINIVSIWKRSISGFIKSCRALKA